MSDTSAIQIELPFALIGDTAHVDRACANHVALLLRLAGAGDGAETDQAAVEKIERWARSEKPRLGRVVISEGAVVAFELWTPVEAFFEYEPLRESDPDTLRLCRNALAAAVLMLR